MLYVVITFLWVSLCLYLLLGGADFGAGIVELTTRREHRLKVKHLMARAIGPVWEANHMWLIIAIVILFVGFPTIYTSLSTFMHIPLVAMLLGVIARGTAFVFRSYDAVTDKWQHLYTQIFRASSVVTPFFLGVIAAATLSQTIDPVAVDFYSAYIGSWLTGFGIATGIFTVSLCGYLAATYAISAVANPYDGTLMVRAARRYSYLVIGSGILVLWVGARSEIPLISQIFDSAVSQGAMLLTALSLVLTWYAFQKRWGLVARLAAGFQVCMILLAATFPNYPILILFKQGEGLSLMEHAGPGNTITLLAWALLIGSIFILPLLFYLMWVFSKRS